MPKKGSQVFLARSRVFLAQILLLSRIGVDYAIRLKSYNPLFRMVVIYFRMVFLLYDINKMGTHGGRGVVDGVPLRRLQAIILVPGLNPNPDANLFFVRIHTNEVIHIV